RRGPGLGLLGGPYGPPLLLLQIGQHLLQLLQLKSEGLHLCHGGALEAEAQSVKEVVVEFDDMAGDEPKEKKKIQGRKRSFERKEQTPPVTLPASPNFFGSTVSFALLLLLLLLLHLSFLPPTPLPVLALSSQTYSPPFRPPYLLRFAAAAAALPPPSSTSPSLSTYLTAP
ncbi:MAG: hypothetical protein LQ338_004022, partial [Usnochroma carphineum]